MRSIPLLSRVDTVKRVSRIAEEFHLVSNSSESSTEYRCKFSLKSAPQYEIAFNLTGLRGVYVQTSQIIDGCTDKAGAFLNRYSLLFIDMDCC
jgi:hypothetical protein